VKRHKRQHNNRHNGFGINLYRNTEAGKIGGVCAGVADHFEIDRNICRVAVVGAFIMAAPLTFWGYIIAWAVLVARPNTTPEPEVEYDESTHRYRPKKLFRYRDSAQHQLQRASQKLHTVSTRVTAVERYVTSERFALRQQFKDL